MPQWLRRLLDKHFTRLVYSPEVSKLGPIGDKDWAGLLAELADGYDRHKPIFLAVQILLRRTEHEAFRIPQIKTPADMDLWQAEQFALVREIGVLRKILRLPIEGQKLKAKMAKAEEAKKQKESEDEEADLD